MYLKGSGAEKNGVYAFKLYARALERCQNNEEDSEVMADAQLRVGECLLHGTGTGRDVEEAHVLLTLAVLNYYKKRKTDPFADRSQSLHILGRADIRSLYKHRRIAARQSVIDVIDAGRDIFAYHYGLSAAFILHLRSFLL